MYSQDNVYFCSDLHLNHSNIIKFENRPFLTPEQQIQREKIKNLPWKDEKGSIKKEWAQIKISDEALAEHDNCLIDNWNRIVKKDNFVFHLGDFCMSTPKRINQILDRLNGKIILINGNHDKTIQKNKSLQDRFYLYKDTLGIKIQDNDFKHGNNYIWLSHYPHLSYDRSHHGSWHLFGHCHGNLPKEPNFGKPVLDVGVDSIAKIFGKTKDNYRPIGYKEMKQIILNKLNIENNL